MIRLALNSIFNFLIAIALIIILFLILLKGHNEFLILTPAPLIFLVLAYLPTKHMNKLVLNGDELVIRNCIWNENIIDLKAITNWEEKSGFRLRERLLIITSDNHRVVLSSICDKSNYIDLINKLILEKKEKEIVKNKQ